MEHGLWEGYLHGWSWKGETSILDVFGCIRACTSSKASYHLLALECIHLTLCLLFLCRGNTAKCVPFPVVLLPQSADVDFAEHLSHCNVCQYSESCPTTIDRFEALSRRNSYVDEEDN
jgi:hypothetical protein